MRRRPRRRHTALVKRPLAIVLATLLVAAVPWGTPAAARAASVHAAYVNVSVATLWVTPGIARPVDHPSLTNPVNMSAWVGALTTAQRQWLVGRLETQATWGTRVLITGSQGAWSHIVVPSQPTPRDPRGYPGWVPTVQLTGNLSLATHQYGPVAIVTNRTAWLRTQAGAQWLRISFGTRLAWLGPATGGYLVATPRGGRMVVARSAVAVYRDRSHITRPTGAALVATAERFLGLRYLWAGVSAWGFDCSGLTHAVYRRFGIQIPRDADAQAAAGRPVSSSALRPGDLLFFAGPGGAGAVHHVAMYIGSGRMIESPNSAASVRIVSVASEMNEFAGARRYL
jgi:gamma-D-glutamyl-L-lysine dipeptidyl-peptidase